MDFSRPFDYRDKTELLKGFLLFITILESILLIQSAEQQFTLYSLLLSQSLAQMTALYVFKSNWQRLAIVQIIVLNIFQLYFSFFPTRIYMTIKIILLTLNFYLEISPKKTLKNCLNMELLTTQVKRYQYTPYKYITQQMSKLGQWKNLSNDYLEAFFQEIGDGYNEIPYHNITHAFDVSVTLDRFLVQFQMAKYVCQNDQQRIYMLIAAYAHDLGHQGFNNTYYIENDHNLAIQYSYLSPLENLHSSNLMRILRKYDKIVPKSYRKNLTRMILMTDIANQSQDDLLQLKQIGGRLGLLCKKQKIFLAGHLLHAADINNTAKDLDVSLKWNSKLYEQFQKQESLKKNCQKKLLERIPKLKRTSSGANEINFIDKFVLPLYKQLGEIQPKFNVMVEKIEENKTFWMQQAL